MSKSPSASPLLSVREFFARFPNDDACLDHIMNIRFGGTVFDCPKCATVNSTFHRLVKVRAYACASCGHHVHPTADTILHDTRTPLVSWFYAMYLFATTRHGVSGKELQRQLGVTYKTAYRIGMQIRTLMGKADFDGLLSGHVEADETYIGGRRSGGKRGRGAPGKTIVMGVKERNWPLITEVIPNVRKPTLRSVINETVEKGSTVSTDELMSCGGCCTNIPAGNEFTPLSGLNAIFAICMFGGRMKGHVRQSPSVPLHSNINASTKANKKDRG
jgi:transposase